MWKENDKVPNKREICHLPLLVRKLLFDLDIKVCSCAVIYRMNKKECILSRNLIYIYYKKQNKNIV